MRMKRDMLTAEEWQALGAIADGATLPATRPETLRLVGLGLVQPHLQRLRLTSLGVAILSER